MHTTTTTATSKEAISGADTTRQISVKVREESSNHTLQTALEYIANELGADKSDVVFCGDSGNDVFPLTAGFSGVLVRNADDQLVANVKHAMDKNPELKIYFAKGGFKGLNGYYTSGVIEGAYHYGVFSDD